MEYITQQLEFFGLSNYEARVLTALLELSPASASHIAKKCALSRSSVYTTLSLLIAKGLVGTSYRNEVKQFVFEGYNALEQLLEKEKNAIDKKVGVLKKIQEDVKKFEKSDFNIPQTVFFEGIDGLKKIYISMMWDAPRDSVMHIVRDEFIWSDEWGFVFEEQWRSIVRRMKLEKNVTTKLLINDSKLERGKTAYYKKTKGLAFKFLAKGHKVERFAQYIIGDIVSVMSMEDKNLIGIKMTNKNLAKNYHTMFDVMWKSGK